MSEGATRRYASLTFLRGALAALTVALLGGLLSVLHYLPPTSAVLRSAGLDFAELRPLHTTFATAWIFLAALAVVHRYLEDQTDVPVSPGERWRLRGTVLLWAAAGGGVVMSLLLGVSSGREYMGFHPLLSIPILLGWLLFAWNFFRITRRGFWDRPIYVSMWGVGAVFFVVTFLEQHLYLLPQVFAEPVVDLRLQWKACGTLVGSFNLFVYGSLYYVVEQLTGDERPARSRLAYALFAVGLLNSFTNFAHHTYHLPQRELIKWISFVISMTELVILARVVWDLAASARASAPPQRLFHADRFFVGAAKGWTAAMLLTSILISVPPLNALIHGTHVVTGHAMGTTIGIDSMILFAALAWLLTERLRRQGRDVSPLHDRRTQVLSLALNGAVAGLVGWLSLSGVVVGVARYQHLPPPAWVAAATPVLFASLGGLTALLLASLLTRWVGAAFRTS